MDISNHVIYISGQMSGITDFNFQLFIDMEYKLKNELSKCQILNPISHPAGLDYEEYMKLDFAMIDQCDTVVLLPGWELSPGANREVAHAVNLGKNVITPKILHRILNKKLRLT